MEQTTKTAEQVLQEHYGKHGQCTIQQARFVRWEDAINAMEAYAAQRPTVAPNEKLYRWVKASERLPEKVGYNYFIRATKQGLGYNYNDTAIYRGNNEWDMLYYGTPPTVVEWLEQLTHEQATPVAAATVAPVAEGEGFDYPAAARAIALWLKKYCNEELPYPEMIADAARKVKQDRDNWVEMWRTSCDEIKFYKQFVEKERKVTKESLQLRQQLQSLQADKEALNKVIVSHEQVINDLQAEMIQWRDKYYSLNTEMDMAVEDMRVKMDRLQAENKALTVQNAAYKTSHDLAMKFKSVAEEKAGRNQSAADSLESEREMNATLTEENEKLQAENTELRKKNGWLLNRR